MKKFKNIIIGISIFSLFIGLFFFLEKREHSSYLIIGDYVSKNQNFDNEVVVSFSSVVGDYLLNNKIVDEVNSSYLNNGMTSKKLLEMIEKGIYNEKKNNIIKDIKKSKYLTITLGVNDIINNIKYDKLNDKFIYNADVISEKIDMFKHNYYEILNEIKNINNNTNILLVGSYSFYKDNEVFDMINESIKEVADYHDAFYIDVSDINDNYLYLDNNLYLNSLGQAVISNKVILKIKENS